MAGNESIEIYLEDIHHLFEPKHLNPLKNSVIQGSGMDVLFFRSRTHFRYFPKSIILHLPLGEYDKEHIIKSVKKYCDSKIESIKMHQVAFKNDRRINIITGLLFLITCLGISKFMIHKIHPESLQYFLKEGLVIVGWISIWRPTEILLFDWWPVKKHIRTYERIKEMPITIEIQK